MLPDTASSESRALCLNPSPASTPLKAAASTKTGNGDDKVWDHGSAELGLPEGNSFLVAVLLVVKNKLGMN